MVNNTLTNINTGTIPNPYREFTETIPSGQSKTIYYDYDDFRILSANLTGALLVNFGGSGGQTTIEAGIGYHLNYTATYIQLFNQDLNNPLTVKFAMGIGTIDDSRLTVSGTVLVANANGEPLTVTNEVYTLGIAQTVTIDNSGEVELDPAGAKFTRIQNTGSNNLRLYAADGFILAPFGIEEITLNAPFKIYGAEGDTLVFGRFL